MSERYIRERKWAGFLLTEVAIANGCTGCPPSNRLQPRAFGPGTGGHTPIGGLAPAAPGPLRGLGSPGTGLTQTATVPLRLPLGTTIPHCPLKSEAPGKPARSRDPGTPDPPDGQAAAGSRIYCWALV